MSREKRNRRDFLKQAGGAVAGLAGMSLIGASCSARERHAAAGIASSPTRKVSRVSAPVDNPIVVVARDASIWRDDELDADRVRTLLFKAVRTLSGAGSDEDAWSQFFRADDRVAVKINCLSGRRLSTTTELVSGLVAGLGAARVAEGNIAVFDRTTDELKSAGYEINTDKNSLKILGTDTDGVGYENELSMNGEAGSCVSRIVTRFSTALINASVLKDHDLAGVSGCLKNWFGAIHNPNKMHENGCDPYVADVAGLPEFRDRARLFVCDGALAQYEAGPGYKGAFAWKFSGLLVSNDPVAVDAVAHGIIAKKRAEKGLPTLEQEERPARFLASAAERGLGTAGMEKITVKEISL